MKALLSSAFVAVLVVLLGACGTGTDPAVDGADDGAAAAASPAAAHGEGFEAAHWTNWTSTYTDVRPASRSELDALVRRSTALNESSWTAGVGPGTLEIAYTPEHVRARIQGVEVHLDPRRIAERSATPLTVCDVTCIETSTAEENPGAAGGVLPEDYISVLQILSVQMAMPLLAEAVAEHGLGFVAVVDSPIGDLDCYLDAPEGTVASELDGDEMTLDPVLGEPGPVVCVDGRGLVIPPPSGNLSPSYSSWSPGVDADVTDLVAPGASEDGGHDETDPAGTDGPALEISDVSWQGWEPAYTSARMATQADVEALARRIEALNASGWTATFSEDGVELAVGPAHARATIAPGADLHLDPGSLGTFVLCVEDDGCVEDDVSARPDEGDLLAPMATYLVEAVRAQRAPGLSLDDETAYAVLDSPVGTLECLIGLRGAALQNLQGARPDIGEGDPEPGTATEDRVCVDERGLVLLGRVRRAPLLEITSWRAGTPDGYDEHAEASPR